MPRAKWIKAADCRSHCQVLFTPGSPASGIDPDLVSGPNGLSFIANCYKIRSMQLISNKALRDFATMHPDADTPLRAFRSKVEKGHFANFAILRATFMGVDKVGERFVFNIGGNKYRLIASIAFSVQRLWVKAVLTHAEYDKGDWK